MGYVKSMLPEDWEVAKSTLSDDEYFNNLKYYCVSGFHNPNIRDKWLPRWYGVPFENCLFYSEERKNSKDFQDWDNVCKTLDLILLTDLPKGTNYKQKLKELKTERLLDGNDIR